MTGRRTGFRRGLVLLLSLAMLAYIMYDRVEVVRDQQDVAHAWQTDLRARFRGAGTDVKIAVVRITDADYDSLFQAHSPLNASRLGEIISAIAELGAVAIGVDLDTSDPSFAALEPASSIPVIWARDAARLCMCEAAGSCGIRLPVAAASRHRYCRDGERGLLVPFRILGGLHDNRLSGIASLRIDSDGSIRKYQRSVPTVPGELPTFASRLVAFHPERPGRRAYGDADALYIRYDSLGSATEYTAREVLESARADVGPLLEGRVVLLGGDFWAGRDDYATPFGRIPGVDVHAHILRTELLGAGVPPASGTRVIALLVVLGVLVLLCFHFWPFEIAFRRALALIILASPLASWLATGSPVTLLLYFAPVLVVLLIQQMRSHIIGEQKGRFRGILHDVLREEVAVDANATHSKPDQKELGPQIDRWVRATVRDLRHRMTSRRRSRGDAERPEPNQSRPEDSPN